MVVLMQNCFMMLSGPNKYSAKNWSGDQNSSDSAISIKLRLGTLH